MLTIILKLSAENGRYGVIVTARDDGSGVSDVSRSPQPGYSKSGGLGLGLTWVKGLMDQFEIVSLAGQATTATVAKWREQFHPLGLRWPITCLCEEL